MKWQKELPNTEGDWLWVIMWDCGCCIYKSGIVFVFKDDRDTYQKLPNDLSISWEAEPLPEHNTIEHITAWMKIELPPKDKFCD